MNTKQRLYRTSSDRMIAGVAGGLAEYFDIDPVLTRILFVVLTLSGGFGLLTYIILWIVVPYDYEIGVKPQFAEQKAEYKSDDFTAYKQNESATAQQSVLEEVNTEKNNRKTVAGIILVIIGALLLADNLFSDVVFENIGPVLLILAGIFILYYHKKNNNDRAEA